MSALVTLGASAKRFAEADRDLRDASYGHAVGAPRAEEKLEAAGREYLAARREHQDAIACAEQELEG